MPTIKLNQQLKRVEIKSFEIENEVVFNYFNNLSQEQRDDSLFRALYIGVLALMEDRMSAFFAKTSNELGTQLESLKMIFEMKKELFYKSTVKGMMAEDEIAAFLNDYFAEKKIQDKAMLTGTATGALSKTNKTGDIICELNGLPERKIVIECKYDKSIKLGDIESKDIFTKKSDTAWSQLIEAQANRTAAAGIIVFDISLIDNSILKVCESVGYIPGIGFIAVVDSQKGNYTNLVIAYMLARDIALNARQTDMDNDVLTLIIKRIVKDIEDVMSIKKLVMDNIDNNKKILKQIEKSMLMMEFNMEYLLRFLSQGTLSKSDLLNFYSGEEVKGKYASIDKAIAEIGTA